MDDLFEHIVEVFGADHWRAQAALERWCFVRRDAAREYQREWRRRPESRRKRREYDARAERKKARRAYRARRDTEIAAIRAAAPRWNPPPPAPFTPKRLAHP